MSALKSLRGSSVVLLWQKVLTSESFWKLKSSGWTLSCQTCMVSGEGILARNLFYFFRRSKINSMGTEQVEKRFIRESIEKGTCI